MTLPVELAGTLADIATLVVPAAAILRALVRRRGVPSIQRSAVDAACAAGSRGAGALRVRVLGVAERSGLLLLRATGQRGEGAAE